MEIEDAHQECILVADGDVIARHAIADYLRHCGYVVIEATSSDEVVTVLQAPDLPVHFVLCDAQIGGRMTGFELGAWIRAERPAIKVALTGATDKTAKVAAQLCDAGPHLSRPYDPQMVVEHIKTLLENARTGSDRFSRASCP